MMAEGRDFEERLKVELEDIGRIEKAFGCGREVAIIYSMLWNIETRLFQLMPADDRDDWQKSM